MKEVFHFVKSNKLSGLENVVLNIMTMVDGYDYTYVSPSGPIDRILKSFGIKHIIISSMNPFSVHKVIKKYNPDIVHSHDPKASVCLAFNKYYCYKHNILMISQLHNDDLRMRKKYNIIPLLYCMASFTFPKIVSVSKDIELHYAFSFLINKKTTVISNVVNSERIYNYVYNIDPIKKWDVAFLGRLSYVKNPEKFINIVVKLRNINENIKAIIIGDGELLSKIKHLSRLYNLDNNIKFVGFQKNPYKYLKQSKILVITSRFEGFCLVALESLLIGVPVVSTPLKVLKKIIDKKCGFFAKNKEEFVMKILYIMNNKMDYRNKSSYAKEKANKVNDVQKFINSYKKIYH